MAHSLLFRRLVLALQTARNDYLKAQGLPEPLPLTSQQLWSRRRFMKTGVAASIGGLAGPMLSYPAAASVRQGNARIAIIGAGIAGLNAAHQLQKAGISATVYEARPRTGGRMLSTIKDGLVYDIGAELINTDHADMLALTREFRIDLFNKLTNAAKSPYPKEIYLFDGVRYSEAQLAEDLAAIAAQITEDSQFLDHDWDFYAPLFDQLSVADYLNQHSDKLPNRFIFQLLQAAIRTEYGVELDESSALQLLFILPVVQGDKVNLLSYSNEVFAVKEGSGQITDALARSLSGQIQLNTVLQRIDQQGNEYRLTFSNRTEAAADIVIVTLPFPALRRVTLNANLPNLFRRFVNECGLGANEKLMAGFSKRFWHQADGFTGAAWSNEGYAEVWDESQRQPDRVNGALNFFLGGNQARQDARNPNTRLLGNQFIAALDQFIPGALDSASNTFIRSGWAQSPYTQGGYANFKPGQLTTFAEYFWVDSQNPNARQEVAFDNLIFAGEHLSDAYYGFMNGGAETGRLAAAHALSKITIS
jgi:monoamine oxidase